MPHVSVDVVVRLADALDASLDVPTGRVEESEEGLPARPWLAPSTVLAVQCSGLSTQASIA
jgi:hypothetical protein